MIAQGIAAGLEVQTNTESLDNAFLARDEGSNSTDQLRRFAQLYGALLHVNYS